MAFDLEAWGLPLVVLGILLMLLTKRMKRFLGLSIVGLGLVFIGMDIMVLPLILSKTILSSMSFCI